MYLLLPKLAIQPWIVLTIYQMYLNNLNQFKVFHMGRDMGEDMARDMGWNMGQDMARDMGWNMGQDMGRDMGWNMGTEHGNGTGDRCSESERP